MWMSVVMKIMLVFMSKKMKARVGNFGTDWAKLAAEVGGPQ